MENAGYAAFVSKLSALALWKTGWRHVNRKHGWSVDINEAKWLTVEKVTASSDTKFD